MSSDWIEWTHRCLETDADVIVPLGRLWQKWRALAPGPDFDEFAQAILADERFEQTWSIDNASGLEQFGYFPGPRIKLRVREVTEQSVLRLLQQHHERILAILGRTRQILPEQDGDALRDAMTLLEELLPAFRAWTHLDERPGPDLD